MNALSAPVADVNRLRLQSRSQQVMQWVARTLAAGGYHGKLKLVVGTAGTALLVYTNRPDEVRMTLPPVVGGLVVRVI